MTEDEAKTKWCPMARVATLGGANRRSDNAPPVEGFLAGMCVGSKCALWRWDYVRGERRYERKRQDTGFCGLGGTP